MWTELKVEMLAWTFDTHLASATPSLARVRLLCKATETRYWCIAMWARTERVYRSGICDWNADAPAPDSWVYDSRTEFRQELCIGPCQFRCHFYMQQVLTGTCMETWTLLVGPAEALIASKAKHSESFGPALLGQRHADVSRPLLLCHRWYLRWSGDMVTLDGGTFLDMQLAPHQAEASTLAKHSIICYKEREAMSNSVDT